MISKWKWFVSIPLFIIVAFVAYWVYEYSTHSTPQKALSVMDSTVGPFETIPFAKGVILLTPSSTPYQHPISFTSWYMKKSLWGWQVIGISNAIGGLAPQNYNVDFESITFDGETFVWGTAMIPLKEIVYNHSGKIYTSLVGKSPVWYMILPFTQSYFPHWEWTMILPNGKTAPLFK